MDALDQLDDEAKPEETVIPTKLAERQKVHIDRRDASGRHIGEWHDVAEYEPVECDLAQEQLRDNARWREWCEKMAKPQ